MTPNQADVKVLQTMVDTMVGIPKFSYPARQEGAKKPEGEFAHIRLLEEYQESIPKQIVKVQDVSTTTYEIISLARLRFRIGVIDASGLPSAKIMHGWTSEAMKALMISSGYGFISCAPLSNEDALLEKEWEYRKGFSVQMYVTRKYEEVVDNITALTVQARFVEGDLEEYLAEYNINNV